MNIQINSKVALSALVVALSSFFIYHLAQYVEIFNSVVN